MKRRRITLAPPRSLPPRHRHRNLGQPPGGPPVNVYALEGDPAELPLEQPSYLTGDGGVSFEEGGQYYARDDDGDPGPPRMTWVTPRRAPPPFPLPASEPRAKTAAVLLKHKGELSEFKDDVRAVRRLEAFKLPRGEFRV